MITVLTMSMPIVNEVHVVVVLDHRVAAIGSMHVRVSRGRGVLAHGPIIPVVTPGGPPIGRRCRIIGRVPLE